MKRFDPDTVQNGHIYSWVRLRILVMKEVALRFETVS